MKIVGKCNFQPSTNPFFDSFSPSNVASLRRTGVCVSIILLGRADIFQIFPHLVQLNHSNIETRMRDTLGWS